MKRIASGSQSASAPASYGADSGTPGYFVDAATSPSGSPTQLTPKWANMVQEAVVQTIEASGATPADTLSQFSDVVVGVHASKAHATDTGEVTTAMVRGVFAGAGKATGAGAAVIGSTNTGGYCLASGAGSVVAGSAWSTASGASSGVLASTSCTASNVNSACVGGASNAASGANSVCLGGTSAVASASYAATCGGDNPTASGTGAGVLAGEDGIAAGDYAAVVGGSGNNVTANGDRSVAAGGDTNTIDATDSFMGATTGSFIPAGQRCATLGCQDVTTADNGFNGRVILASRGVVLESSKTTGGTQAWVVGGGYSTATVSGLETANDSLTWTIASQTGNVVVAGTVSGSSDPNADVAEFHENATKSAIPVGCLVANVGRKVRLAAPGDAVFGAVSATPLLVAGTAELGWAGRYLRDEWGRTVWQTVDMVRWAKLAVTDADGVVNDVPAYDGPVSECRHHPVPAWAEYYTAQDRVTVDAYDPTRAYTPRSDRPAEWTPVAKLGVVRVRVAKAAKAGDLLAPGPDGVAVPTDKPRGRRTVEVLEVLSAFDATRGYAVALCDIG